jgi:gamma-glutamylputrescine oxidase
MRLRAMSKLRGQGVFWPYRMGLAQKTTKRTTATLFVQRTPSPLRLHSRRLYSTNSVKYGNALPSALGKRKSGRWKRVPLVIAVGLGATYLALWGLQPAAPEDTLPASKDHPGYLNTYYAATIVEKEVDRPPLSGGKVEADVCVIGGGYSGLHTALGLAERGKKVVLVEDKRIGWSASGMNGGFAVAGFQVDGAELVDIVGEEKASRMVKLSLQALKLLRDRISKHNIQCSAEDVGCLEASYYKMDDARLDKIKQEVHHLNQVFGTKLEVWPESRVRALYHSEKFHHGIFDPTAFSIHPLNLCLGLARVAEEAGVQIFEHTRAIRVDAKQEAVPDQKNITTKKVWHVTTKSTAQSSEPASFGTVVAKEVVLCGAARIGSTIDGRINRAVAPVYTYIMVTEPLGERLKTAIEAPHAVGDDRFALNYFRPLSDGRLLWGGFAQTYPITEEELHQTMMKDMLKVFPQLAGVKSEYVWGGTIAYGLKLMPMIGKTSEGLWYCEGFGGHGIVPTALAGISITRNLQHNYCNL